MKKIAVNIASQQDVRLKALATALGVTQAELLRKCLEEGLARMERELSQRSHSFIAGKHDEPHDA
jgi:predicted DNA-binding protein